MKELTNIKNIAVALGKFQNECPAIEKSKKGYNYKYADLPAIIETISPILEKNGLAFTQLISGDHETVIVSTFLIHCESGETLDTNISGNVSENKGKMTNIQAQGSVITYLRRYSLAAMLGIVTDEDVDGSIEKSKNQPKAPEKPKGMTVDTIVLLIEKETDSKRLDQLKVSDPVKPFLKNKLFIDALKKQYDKLKPNFPKSTNQAHLELSIKLINATKSVDELTKIHEKEKKFQDNEQFMKALKERKTALNKLFIGKK